MARKALFRAVMVAMVWYLSSIALEFRLLLPGDDIIHNNTYSDTINPNNMSTKKEKDHLPVAPAGLPVLADKVTPITNPTTGTTSFTPQNEPNSQVVAHDESIELSVGRVYSARACHLEPGWGGGGNTTAKHCVGSKPTITNTTAQYLTCDHEKPTLSQHIHQDGFTIALLYFAKPAMLFKQLEEFASYAPEIQQSMTVLIIDDGSPAGLRVTDYFNMSTYSASFRIRLATIVTERNWNIGGARNLAFYLSDTPMTVLLDLDILVPPPVIRTALTWPLVDPKTGQQFAHRFNRRRLDGSERVHPAICVIGTKAYWENGGCDEDFCGNYGFTDVHFWYRWKADPHKKLLDHKDVYLQEFKWAVCDADILGEPKATLCKEARSRLKNPGRNIYKNFGLMKEKKKKGCWSNRYLRFRWILEN